MHCIQKTTVHVQRICTTGNAASVETRKKHKSRMFSQLKAKNLTTDQLRISIGIICIIKNKRI